MKEGSDLTGAAEIVSDTRYVFNFVSSDVNMARGWKRSVVANVTKQRRDTRLES